MATVSQLHANQKNAQLSTGPRTIEGKAAIGGNALKAGLRSARLFVDGEDPQEFAKLCEELNATLHPVGAIEAALAERISVALWRQRRLLQAETAAIDLNRRSSEIAKAVSRLDGAGFHSVTTYELQPFDQDHEGWCRAVVVEVEALQEITLETLADNAPLVHAQLLRDAADQEEEPDEHVAQLQHGLTTYVGDLVIWCRKQLDDAERRPQLLRFAEQLRAKNLALPTVQLEVIARYQTTLDNQLYKALKAFREAQEWRLKTLEQSPCSAAPLQSAAT